jgi:LytS/YehU family sensor histidine kinase
MTSFDGLTEQSARSVAEIILKLMNVSAVAITNRTDILTIRYFEDIMRLNSTGLLFLF